MGDTKYGVGDTKYGWLHFIYTDEGLRPGWAFGRVEVASDASGGEVVSDASD